MLVMAHVSDLHFDGGERAAGRAARVMRYLDGLDAPLDAVLVTGDIADHGLPAEYEEARKIFSTRHRMLPCPGNHDVRAAYREVMLGEPAADGPVDRAHRVGGALVAMCDSSVPGRPDGYLADETLEWLDGVLAEDGPDVPAFVCFHHPPVTLANAFVDPIRQFGAERLARVLDRHPRVVAVLCGHAHTPATTTFAGRPLLVAPGVVSTLRLLPWERGEEVLDFEAPAAVAFHVLDDDGRLITHYRAVP